MELDMTFTHAGSAQHALRCVVPHVHCVVLMQFAHAHAVCFYIWRCAGGDPGAGGGVPATAGGGGAVLAAAERAAETAGGGAEAPGVGPRNCQVQEQGEREFVMFRSRVSETLSTSGAG